MKSLLILFSFVLYPLTSFAEIDERKIDVYFANVVSISTDGTKAYIVDGYSGLQIADISDPTNSTIIGSIDTSGYAQDISISTDGTKAFIANGYFGLKIVDLTGL
jgi:hypothetical protein